MSNRYEEILRQVRDEQRADWLSDGDLVAIALSRKRAEPPCDSPKATNPPSLVCANCDHLIVAHRERSER